MPCGPRPAPESVPWVLTPRAAQWQDLGCEPCSLVHVVLTLGLVTDPCLQAQPQAKVATPPTRGHRASLTPWPSVSSRCHVLGPLPQQLLGQPNCPDAGPRAAPGPRPEAAVRPAQPAPAARALRPPAVATAAGGPRLAGSRWLPGGHSPGHSSGSPGHKGPLSTTVPCRWDPPGPRGPSHQPQTRSRAAPSGSSPSPGPGWGRPTEPAGRRPGAAGAPVQAHAHPGAHGAASHTPRRPVHHPRPLSLPGAAGDGRGSPGLRRARPRTLPGALTSSRGPCGQCPGHCRQRWLGAAPHLLTRQPLWLRTPVPEHWGSP